MALPALDTTRLADLRIRAARQLTHADAVQESTTRATQSMSVLHALASSPATAEDALAVLHELQVHQVELELQAEELRESRAELEAALRRQQQRHDGLPVACFTLDRDLVIRGLNQAGARMLGLDHDAACGRNFDAWVAAASVGSLRGLVDSLVKGGSARATLRWRGVPGADPSVRVEVSHDPSGGGYLVALMDLGEPSDC